MHADGVQAVAVHALEKARAVAHEPDHELALRFHTQVHTRMLHIRRLAFGFKDKVDLRMLLRAWVDLAGACGEFDALRLSKGGDGGEKEEQGTHELGKWV